MIPKMRDHPTSSLPSSDREKSVNKWQQQKGTRAVLGNVAGRSAEREGGGERDNEEVG